MASSSPDIDALLNQVPHLRRGPGGVIAVLQHGKLLGQRAWGYADLDKRIPMTAQTHFPVCSISKQMVCLVMISLEKNPSPKMKESQVEPSKLFEEEMWRLLPGLAKEKEVKLKDLFNMQSGIRDYWAMTTLWGASPDGEFSLLIDAPQALERIKSYHFAPGTEYSYSNVNFHVLGRILENVSGMSLAQLLVERLFIPAGMSTAALCPNTVGLPLPIVGYEGTPKTGYFKATNRIEWAGDAGIAVTLEDMIAYEKYLIQDPDGLYAVASQQQKYRDGTDAEYGYGLSRGKIAEKDGIGHGGALRGFKHFRIQMVEDRISVVAMHNFEVNPGVPVEHVVKGMLKFKDPDAKVYTAAEGFKGNFLDPETQLYVAVVDGPKPGKIGISYGPGTGEEMIDLTSETEGKNEDTKLTLDGDVLHMEREHDNRTLRLERIQPPTDNEIAQGPALEYVGTYYCEESDSTFNVTNIGGAWYGSFDGYLGKGPIWMMWQLGGNVFVLGNPRGLDSTPPGDWTVVFQPAKDGKSAGVTVGCWLARKVEYKRVEKSNLGMR